MNEEIEQQAQPTPERHQTRQGVLIWDGVVRTLHWLQVIAITGSVFTGFLFYFKEELGMPGDAVKYAIMTLHVLIGYVVISGLIVRLIWGFTGSANARWKNVLPAGTHFAQFFREAGRVIRLKPNRSFAALFLNRVMISAMFVALLVMAITGLIRAGFDLYHWPVGPMVQSYVAAEGVDPSTIRVGSSDGIDDEKWANLRPLKIISVEIHLYTAYFILFLIVTHIVGVVLMDGKRRGGVISPMFIGRRYQLGQGGKLGRDVSEEEARR